MEFAGRSVHLRPRCRWADGQTQGEVRTADKPRRPNEGQEAIEAARAAEPFKRWTARRKAAAVLDLIEGWTAAAQIARQHDVTVGQVEKWLETFTAAGQEPCDPTRGRATSSMRPKGRNSTPRSANGCGSSMSKKTHRRGLAGLRGRDLVIAVRNDLLAEGRETSLVRLCRWIGVPRSTVYYPPRQREARPVDGILVNLVHSIVQAFPTFGIRRVWAYPRYRLKWRVNLKKVARILRHFGWCVRKRRKGGRPRMAASRSVAAQPDRRWASDVALVFCGARNGWCAFVPVLDRCTRQVLGWEWPTRHGSRRPSGCWRWRCWGVLTGRMALRRAGFCDTTTAWCSARSPIGGRPGTTG